MRVDGNYGSTLGYEPNSYGEWEEQPEFAEPPLKLDGAADHWNFREDDDDYYTQPGKTIPVNECQTTGGTIRKYCTCNG